MQPSVIAILAVFLKLGSVFSSPVLDSVSAGTSITTKDKSFIENKGEYPFIASLAYYGMHRCGATIIKPLFVLTAAHCFDNWDPTKWMVRAGSFLKNDSPKKNNFVQEIAVIKFKNHPEYHPKRNSILDLSVVMLEKPFEFNYLVSAIQLPKANMAKKFIKKKLTILGYGEKKDFVDSDILRKGVVVVSKNANNQVCGKIPYVLMCTVGDNSNTGMHFGDSGGPAILEVPGKPASAVIVGISSRGISPPGRPGKPSPKSPTIYVEVATVREWIDFIIQDLRTNA